MTASARGLFRATGKTGRPVATRLLDGSYAKVDSLERHPHDFSPTPPEPTLAFLSRERIALARFPLIWEPACGDGRMVRDIESAGHQCVGTDIIDRGCGATIADFFGFNEPLAPAIITNPPYNRVNARDGDGAWIWHALDVLNVEYMALLLNWSWPGAGALARLWHEHTPSITYLMRWKIDFTGQGAPPMLNAWFVWDRARPPIAPGETRLAMMDRSDVRQGDLLEPQRPVS